MRIIQTIKPQIITGHSKQNILSKIDSISWLSYNSGRYSFSGYYTFRNNKKLGINFEKRRKKTELITKGKNKGQRQVTKEKYWIAYVYKFDKNYPINIKQNSRNFNFTLKKET